MLCEKCNTQIEAGEEVSYRGQKICEDCYVEALEPPRTCDVAAVYSAKLARKMAGQEGTDGLTELQKNVYEFVKTNGSVTHEQIMQALQLTRLQLDKTFATLRHCELLRAFKSEGQVFVTLWAAGGPGEIGLAE